ncbi:Putative cysteine proteinase [Toxocara canis]|uniref:Putative cysteine proteinase n=1 Tax=Toxocara canis TaxID=6265 RepID=A0A0B2V2T1_TOXCA|nr:Putative cysteine proteinase [Toxocara canis]
MDFSMKPPFIDEEEEDFFEITPKRKRRTRGLKWLAAATLCFVAIYFIYGFIAQLATDHRFTASWLWWWKKSALSDGTVELHYLDSFEKFMKRYERQYENSEEVLNRLKTFIQNMNNAKRLNDANSAASARFGENIFADWTDDEFENILMSEDALRELRKMANFIRPANKKTLKTEEVPDYFDWRPFNVVTPVKSQFKCGSCWAFATVAVVESAYAIANGELRSLSEQQLLDCDLNDNACDGGRVENALQYVYENGLMNEDDYPYVAHRQDACYLRGATARIKSAVFLHQDEASIIDWLLHYGPVNVVINTTADLKLYTGGVYTPQKWECENKIIGLHALSIVGYGIWNETNEKYWIVKNIINTTADLKLYTGGVYTPQKWECENKIIGLHALSIVGYGIWNETNEKYWIVKNSWGQRYGVEHGYVYFARGINACGIEDQPMGVIA